MSSLTTEGGDAKALEEAIVGIPGFWLQVFRNIDALSEMIQVPFSFVLCFVVSYLVYRNTMNPFSDT